MSVDEALILMQEEMREHYTDKRFSCKAVAFHFAWELLKEGHFPDLRLFAEYGADGLSRPFDVAVPHVGPWHSHYVACVGTTAYEPLLGEPVLLSEVSRRLFSRPIPHEVFWNAQEIFDVGLARRLQPTFARPPAPSLDPNYQYV